MTIKCYFTKAGFPAGVPSALADMGGGPSRGKLLIESKKGGGGGSKGFFPRG